MQHAVQSGSETALHGVIYFYYHLPFTYFSLTVDLPVLHCNIYAHHGQNVDMLMVFTPLAG